MDSRFYSALGHRVAHLRKTQGYSQERFAERAGISASYVAHIEAGDRRPSLDTLGSIAAGLEVPIWRLFVDELQPADDDWSEASRRLIEAARGLSADDVDLLVATAERFKEAGLPRKRSRRPRPKRKVRKAPR